jgi:hypothetical protein
MATPILSSIPNPLTTSFNIYDLQTIQAIDHQLAVLGVAIGAARITDRHNGTLEAIQACTVKLSANLSGFKQEMETRLHLNR